MKKTLLAALVMFCAVALFAERKVELVAIEPGKMFNDLEDGPTQEYDAETIGAPSIKATWTQDGVGHVGIIEPTSNRNWSKAESINFEIFNPTENMIQVQFVTVPAGLERLTRYPHRCDQDFMLRPGLNKISFDIGEFTSNDGVPLDLKDVDNFYWWPHTGAINNNDGKPLSLYFKTVYLLYAD